MYGQTESHPPRCFLVVDVNARLHLDSLKLLSMNHLGLGCVVSSCRSRCASWLLSFSGCFVRLVSRRIPTGTDAHPQKANGIPLCFNRQPGLKFGQHWASTGLSVVVLSSMFTRRTAVLVGSWSDGSSLASLGVYRERSVWAESVQHLHYINGVTDAGFHNLLQVAASS